MTISDQPKPTRREFVRRETEALGRFLDAAPGHLVAWNRTYRCACGFTCTAAGDIYDHVDTCADAQTGVQS